MILKCPYCNYEWEPKKKNPKSCPRCKRYKADKKWIKITKSKQSKGEKYEEL